MKRIPFVLFIAILIIPSTPSAVELPGCLSTGTEINGDFNNPVITDPAGWQLFNPASVPAWETVAGQPIELWQPNFINPVSPTGGQRAEIQSTTGHGYFLRFESGYQSGTLVLVEVDHAARSGFQPDIMQIQIGEPRFLLFRQVSNTTAWTHVRAGYEVPSHLFSNNMQVFFLPEDRRDHW